MNEDDKRMLIGAARALCAKLRSDMPYDMQLNDLDGVLRHIEKKEKASVRTAEVPQV